MHGQNNGVEKQKDTIRFLFEIYLYLDIHFIADFYK